MGRGRVKPYWRIHMRNIAMAPDCAAVGSQLMKPAVYPTAYVGLMDVRRRGDRGERHGAVEKASAAWGLPDGRIGGALGQL